MFSFLRILALPILLGSVCFQLHSSETVSSNSFSQQSQTVDLSVNSAKYKAIYQAAEKKQLGGIVLVQGNDQRRFESKALQYLRRHLPKEGWSTLAVNLPRVGGEGQEITALLPEAIRQLRSKGANRVVVLLYGQGSGALLSYLTQKKIKRVDGLAFVSSFSRDKEAYKSVTDKTRQLNFPIFDITAEFDVSIVRKNQDYRQRLLNKTRNYRSTVIAGATHDYDGSYPSLLKWLKGWLKP